MPRFDVIAGIQRAFTRACTLIPSWAHRAIFRSAGVKHTNWDRQATPAACVATRRTIPNRAEARSMSNLT